MKIYKHTSEDIDKEQLKVGIDVEKEHTDLLDFIKKFLKENNLTLPISDEEFFAYIAKAHIREMKDYYIRLKKMESEAEKD